MENSVSTEDKIEWEVKQIRNHRSWGTSCMQAEHIKGWLAEAQKEDASKAKIAATEGTLAVFGGIGGAETEDRREKTTTEMTNWERVVELVKEAFG